MHTLQCRTVGKTCRFSPVNQIKTDGCLIGLLTRPKRRALAAFWSCNQTGCQSFIWLTGPKRGQNSTFWSSQQTHQKPDSLFLVNRTKTPHFSHSSTLQGVHIKTKNTF
ncbi:hypothetical protein Hanom_Chr09g00824531 [Helianthus anomalus]